MLRRNPTAKGPPFMVMLKSCWQKGLKKCDRVWPLLKNRFAACGEKDENLATLSFPGVHTRVPFIAIVISNFWPLVFETINSRWVRRFENGCWYKWKSGVLPTRTNASHDSWAGFRWAEQSHSVPPTARLWDILISIIYISLVLLASMFWVKFLYTINFSCLKKYRRATFCIWNFCLI